MELFLRWFPPAFLISLGALCLSTPDARQSLKAAYAQYQKEQQERSEGKTTPGYYYQATPACETG